MENASRTEIRRRICLRTWEILRRRLRQKSCVALRDRRERPRRGPRSLSSRRLLQERARNSEPDAVSTSEKRTRRRCRRQGLDETTEQNMRPNLHTMHLPNDCYDIDWTPCEKSRDSVSIQRLAAGKSVIELSPQPARFKSSPPSDYQFTARANSAVSITFRRRSSAAKSSRHPAPPSSGASSKTLDERLLRVKKEFGKRTQS